MRIAFILEGTRPGSDPERHFVAQTEEDDLGLEAQRQAFQHFADQTTVRGLEFTLSGSGLIVLQTPNENLTPDIVATIRRHADIALESAIRDTGRS